ncbi:MAG: hypothetical protein KGP28_10560 [Bdellovibrionales bacterium]|nr:hypothetical protein [Bdellovibrionales bacterium]
MNSQLPLISLSFFSLLNTNAFAFNSSIASPDPSPSPLTFQETIKGDDAKALYVRLEKKECAGDGYKDVITKIGQNVICTREKINKSLVRRKYEYKCALSFLIETGELHEMYPIGDDDPDAGLAKDEDGYQGKSVNVKPGGSEATFTIYGMRAQALFDGMKQDSEPAVIREGKFSDVEESETVDNTRKGEQTGTTVFVKKGIHVTCFQATFTYAPNTECTVVLEPKSGKAKLSGEGGMNESSSEEQETDHSDDSKGFWKKMFRNRGKNTKT